MRVYALGVVLLLATACSSEVDQAEREAAMMENAGTAGPELCAAKRKVAAAYLKAGDQRGYSLYQASAESYCLNDKLERQNGTGAYAVDLTDNMTAVN